MNARRYGISLRVFNSITHLLQKQQWVKFLIYKILSFFTLSLPREEIFQVHRKKRLVANLLVVDSQQ